MWPFAVAALGFRYLRINFSDKLGHPLRNPFLTALSRVDILGLHSDWCANFTALTRVRTECMYDARVMAGALTGDMRGIPGTCKGGWVVDVDGHPVDVGMGRVHKSVLGFL
jgi:hypothetical protein